MALGVGVLVGLSLLMSVGGVVGATTYGLDVNNIAQAATNKGKLFKDSILSSTRKVGGEIERELLDI